MGKNNTLKYVIGGGAILIMLTDNPIKRAILSHVPRLVGNKNGPAGSMYARRAYEASSFYHDLGMNPYFMNYGDYGGYYGRGYDYLSNPSPK